jgi:hypothetical protein
VAMLTVLGLLRVRSGVEGSTCFVIMVVAKVALE